MGSSPLPWPLNPADAATFALVALLLLHVLRWFGIKQGKSPKDDVDFIKAAAPGAHKDVIVSDEAERYWAEGYGRWKHCGLRPDPFGPAAPPAYSLVDLDIPLPALAPGEAEGLDALATRVADLKAKGHRADRSTLLRFLRARKGRVAAAEAYFREAAAYRESIDTFGIDRDWNLEAFERCLAPWWLSGGMLGHGKGGEVVAYERIGGCDFHAMLDNVPWPMLQRLDAVHISRALAAMEEDAVRRQVPLGNAILVMDLDGFGWHSFTPSSARAFGKLLQYRDMMMPCTLGHIFVIRAPKAFSAAWALVKHFLDPITRDKVQIVSDGAAALALLRRYVGDDMIPAYLGGARCIDGDPECRRILAPGGRATRRAFERFHKLVAEGPRHDGAPGGRGHRERGALNTGSSVARTGDDICGADACCGVCPRRAS